MLTLDTHFQFLRVGDTLSAFPDHSPVLLCFSPEIGASVHAGDVENSNSFEEDVAQVHCNPIALRDKQIRPSVSILSVSQPSVPCGGGAGALPLTDLTKEGGFSLAVKMPTRMPASHITGSGFKS